MAPKKKITKIAKIAKITKNDRTSRRKRTKGLFSKSHELGTRPSCKVFTFVVYTDVGQVRTYDSTGGDILGEVEAVIERLRRFPEDWQQFDPSFYANSEPASQQSGCRRRSSVEMPSQVSKPPEQKALRSVPPRFDFGSLPMYTRRNASGNVSQAAS